MHSQLVELLAAFRRQRNFRPERYLEARLRLLNDYCRDSGIQSAVVGVSGGIDSAVVLALMARVPALRRVVPALIPMFVEAGATNQDVATARGREVIEALGLKEALVDLSEPLKVTKAAVDRGYGRVGQPWAAGQLVSYLRTPALYYLTALLGEDGLPCILCGTTNRDEGAYIGFFGKASDGMVDLQPISDLHKSEVRQLAQLLGIPTSIMQATPTGDTYDGRPDELMIGAPYDFLELYQNWLCAGRPTLELQPEAQAQWESYASSLEELHSKNLHKYLVGSVAVHLDVLQRPVPGGWRSEVYVPYPPALDPRGSGRLVGEFELRARPATPTAVEAVSQADFGDGLVTFDGLLTPTECAALREEVLAQNQVEVGLHGRVDDTGQQGSGRATAYSPEWAEALWQRLAPAIQQVRVFDELSPTDHGGHPVWRAVGVNPVLRFMCYRPGGQLVPHYDAGFDYGDGRRYTLMSLVVYLSSVPEGAGGRTRFLFDPQRGLPVSERNHEDWTHPAGEVVSLAAVMPQVGRAALFDHRLLHDGEAWEGPGERLIMRTDLIFERCGLLPGKPMAPPEAGPRGSDQLLADPFYAPLQPLLGQAGVEEAGYFEDSRRSPEPDPREQTDWLCTPVFWARERLRLAGSKPLAVLVTTGALCPVHPGHLALMEHARRALESSGYAVLGGYLSPSHDEYVMGKCGPGVPPAQHRAHLCQQAVSGSDWLMVDEWEALHAPVALNFSLVLERLQNYLNRHLRCARPVRVFYVFGSDNARFALSFLRRGQAVCVERPGYRDRLEHYANHPLMRGNSRVLFVREVSLPDVASTQVRKGDFELLAPNVRALWEDWHGPGKARPARLFLRDEGAWSVQHWGQLEQAYARFTGEVARAVEDSFRQARLPDPPSPLHLSLLSLDRQRREALDRFGADHILSLDPCLPGAANLGVSRCFELCANTLRPGLVARPGWPPLEEQLSSIPAGTYSLVDDDIATGHTMEAVRARLPEHCMVERQAALCQLPSLGEGLVDLGDVRDFLVGSWEGGLVVCLPDGQLARVPYLLPYVNPADRLSLPLSQSFAFSRRVWQLNAEFFDLGQLTVADVPPAFGNLCRYLGVPSEMLLADWCRWHLERL
ncbi:NAD(+) synthase [bacterium]|nr:NAD(+) synthase [bacterium]